MTPRSSPMTMKCPGTRAPLGPSSRRRGGAVRGRSRDAPTYSEAAVISKQNVELVRRIYSDGLFDRDPDRIVHEFATPDIQYINPPEAVEPGIRRGRAQVVQALRSSSELFDWRRHEVHELFDCEDAVVAAVSFRASIRGSGAELIQEEAHTWTFRDGRIVRFEWGRDLSLALEAARLWE
jgi:ketosteroid isomerase-like protein